MAADYSHRRRLVAEVKRGTGVQLVVGGRQAIVNGYHEVGKQLPPDIYALGKALDLQLIPEGRLKKANLQIAREAQDAIVAGWRSRLPRNSAPYRPQRRLVGKLGAALADESMTKYTTARRISFINQDTLKTEARHWYRVNYGASGPNLAKGRQPETFTATINGKPLFKLRDQTAPASHSILPPGFHWQGRDEPKEFWPEKNPKEPRPLTGAGIRAARFTDLGLRVVARRLGPVYFKMIEEYGKTKGGQVKFQKHDIRIKGDLRVNRFGVRRT